jgi:hypothetical protein
MRFKENIFHGSVSTLFWLFNLRDKVFVRLIFSEKPCNFITRNIFILVLSEEFKLLFK